jgi:L-fuconolactonase
MTGRRIDAHQHFWRLARGDYGWLTPALEPIHRDFGPAELRPLLLRHDIAASILVQAAPTVAETRFLLDLAANMPQVAGVVGWAPLAAPDAVTQIAALAGDPLLVGLRPMLHDLDDPDWILGEALPPALRAMVRHGLVFDALVRPVHLSRILVLADRYPDLPIIIDHAGKPDLRHDWNVRWAADIAALATRPSVCCKISGLLTEAPPDADAKVLAPVLGHLLQEFGPDRLLWGSDWPVLALAASYDHWVALTEALLRPLPEAARTAILGGTAERIYLNRRGRLPPC